MEKRFALCMSDGGYPESLELRKFYEVVLDSDSEKNGLIRVLDESGEDYLYSAKLFLVSFPSY